MASQHNVVGQSSSERADTVKRIIENHQERCKKVDEKKKEFHDSLSAARSAGNRKGWGLMFAIQKAELNVELQKALYDNKEDHWAVQRALADLSKLKEELRARRVPMLLAPCAAGCTCVPCAAVTAMQ